MEDHFLIFSEEMKEFFRRYEKLPRVVVPKRMKDFMKGAKILRCLFHQKDVSFRQELSDFDKAGCILLSSKRILIEDTEALAEAALLAGVVEVGCRGDDCVYLDFSFNGLYVPTEEVYIDDLC